jgi:AraC-like DNA-binding protein
VAIQRQLRAPLCAQAAPECPLVPLWLVADDIADEARTPLERRLPWKTVQRDSLGPFREAPFESKAILQMQPHLGLMSCFDPAPRWTMPENGSAEAGCDTLLVRPSDGAVTVEQHGRRQTCLQREAIILDAQQSATFIMHGVSRIDCLVLPGRADSTIGLRHIAQNNGALIVLGNYAAAVMRGLLPMSSAALTALAIDYMGALVAAMIKEADDPARSEATRHDRPTLSLLSIKADIEAGLGQPTLSLEQLATTHGVTARYFQKLFEAEGRTFSDYLLERRLERAYQALRNRREASRSVSSIAFDVGFGDLSYFNRTFKKRFGATPRDVRASFEKISTAGDSAA